MPFLQELNGGLCLPQTYCTKLSGTGPVQFTDGVTFSEGKNRIFQIVVLLHGFDEFKPATDYLDGIEGNVSCRLARQHFLSLLCPFIHLQMIKNWTLSMPDYIARSAQKNLRSPTCVKPVLCHMGIMRLMWESKASKRYVLLRPDKFVFAACSTKAEFEQAVRTLVEMFS